MKANHLQEVYRYWCLFLKLKTNCQQFLYSNESLVKEKWSCSIYSNNCLKVFHLKEIFHPEYRTGWEKSNDLNLCLDCVIWMLLFFRQFSCALQHNSIVSTNILHATWPIKWSSGYRIVNMLNLVSLLHGWCQHFIALCG